jgi:pimeloyl-ACP methyl ester carboxylesterase
LPARLVRRTTPKGLVVFWQGGPGGTFSRGQSHFIEQSWLRRGYDIALVEQTGSTDATSLQRLKTEGFSALVKDGSDAADALLEMSGRYDRIVVVGESFGGVPASVTASRLKELGRRSDLLLIAPWLAYRDPSNRGESDEFFRLNPNFARVADAGLFGAPFTRSKDGFGDRMVKWRGKFQFNGRALAIFGENDRVSRPTDLWSAWSLNKMSNITLIGGAGHGTVSQRADEIIESWLGDDR